MTRPNVLLIVTDQQSASAMSCSGNQYLATPAMDSLAAEGVRFDRAYCTQPLCTPCRGSMFTGMMPHECGTSQNGMQILPELREQELGNVMRRAGYDCIYAGKWHVPEICMPDDNDHGFRTISGFDDRVLADACIAYLDEYAAGDGEKPFFLTTNFDNPHNICEFARHMALPWADIGEPPPVDERPPLPENFGIPDDEPEIIRIEQQEHFAIYPTRNWDEADWRRQRWGYFRLVEWVDTEIGRILAGLKARGLDENTVIIFTSDHGDGHGSHQWNQKSVLYEEVVRIPMIIKAPGGVTGVADSRLVSNALDIFPTICDYADAELPSGLSGRSLRPILEGEDPGSWRDRVFIETFFDCGWNSYGRAMVTDRYKYTVYDKGKNREQIVDLQEDPGEMVNLATRSEGESMLEGFRRDLQAWTIETNDGFWVPGYSDGLRGMPRKV